MRLYLKQLGSEEFLKFLHNSENPLGVEMSAFNLKTSFGPKQASVECFYQASKVFDNGGPFLDLIDKSS